MKLKAQIIHSIRYIDSNLVHTLNLSQLSDVSLNLNDIMFIDLILDAEIVLVIL